MSDITAFRLVRLVINILLIGLKTIDFCDIKFIIYLFLINLIILYQRLKYPKSQTILILIVIFEIVISNFISRK